MFNVSQIFDKAPSIYFLIYSTVAPLGILSVLFIQKISRRKEL